MKSYEETLVSIRNKACELIEKRKEQKRKLKTTLFSVVPAFLVIGIVIAAISIAPLKPANDNNTPLTSSLPGGTTAAQTADSLVSTDPNVTGEPSIYPDAWKTMNAFLVQWGEPTNDTDWDGFALRDGDTYRIDYTGVSVTILKCFASTVREDYDENERFGLPDAIKSFNMLYVQKELLEQIRPGDTALVFVKLFRSTAMTDPDGNQLTGINSQGNQVDLMDYLFTPGSAAVTGPEYDPIYAVFPVIDGKLEIPDSAYRRRDGGDYFLFQTSLLQYANLIIDREGLDDVPAFRSGMTVEEIGRFFDYFCGSDYH